MTALIGFNDPTSNVPGVVPYRDLYRNVTPYLLPFKYYPSPPAQGMGFGAGSDSGCSGIDLGMTATDWMLNAAGGSPRPLAGLKIRVDDKYFGTVAHGDTQSTTITPNSDNEGPGFFIGATGRYFGWLGNASNRIGSPDWIEFASDDVEFWCYADPPSFSGASIYSLAVVEAGVGELWAGNTPNGTTTGRVTRIMEITPATSTQEISANLAGSGGCWWVIRKPGTTGFKFRQMERYFKGDDVNKIVFDPPRLLSEDAACALTFSAGSGLTLSGTGIALDVYNQTTGQGTLTLSAGLNPRGVEWNGINGQMTLPAGGLRPTLMLPSGAKYGTAGIINKQYSGDFIAAKAKSKRYLDEGTGNFYTRTTKVAGAIPSGLAMEVAEMAEAAGLLEAHVVLPIPSSADDLKTFARTFYQNTTSCRLHFERGNEVPWNNLGSGKILAAMAAAIGQGERYFLLGDMCHEDLDAIAALHAEGITRPIGYDICGQTYGLSSGVANPNNGNGPLMNRRYQGNSANKALWYRMAELGTAYPGSAQYREAWYTGARQAGVEVSPQTVIAAIGANASVADYMAEISRQYDAAEVACLTGVQAMTDAARQKSQALGFAADAVLTGNYEFNRYHPYALETVSPTSNIGKAFYDYRETQEAATKQGLYVTRVAARTTGTSDFLNLHYREYGVVSGGYGTTDRTGVDTVLNGSNGRIPMFVAVSDAAGTVNAGIVPPIEVPTSYAARTLFRALF